MKVLSILGTSSDSGKSTLTLAIAKILNKRGFKPCPFKAQNMSNNSAVCADGSEIGRAQYFQAETLGIKTDFRLNPVLLKPQGKGISQLVLNGKVKESIHARTYYQKMDEIKPYVDNALESLSAEYDIIVAEGAGSPVELNLMHRDLSNIYVAEKYNSKIILVADIERGGVFASIFGTYKLLPEPIQSNVIGVIINKFRGDESLFDEGKKIIESQFNLKVLGIIPYYSLNIDMEDSLSINNYVQNNEKAKIKMALIQFPKISNYNDIDPLIADPEIEVHKLNQFQSLDNYDAVFLPGSKSTIEDLKWLKKTGFYDEILSKKDSLYIIALCGGYQMLFNKLIDDEGIENEKGCTERGMALIDENIVFKKEKKLNKQNYNLFGYILKGYEIHCGYCEKYELGFWEKNIFGSHIHGIFETDDFRKEFFKKINEDYKGEWSYLDYKKESVSRFVDMVEQKLDIDYIVNNL